MKRILVIDDERTFAELPDALYARTVSEAIAHLQLSRFDEVFWDHDLGPGGDAMEIVDWMDRAYSEWVNHTYNLAMSWWPNFIKERRYKRHPFYIAKSFVHSMNPVGAARLVAALDKHSDEVHRIILPELVTE